MRVAWRTCRRGALVHRSRRRKSMPTTARLHESGSAAVAPRAVQGQGFTRVRVGCSARGDWVGQWACLASALLLLLACVSAAGEGEPGDRCCLGTTYDEDEGCDDALFCDAITHRCVRCPAGTYVPEDSSTCRSACDPCPQGYYCLGGSKLPTACGGMFVPSAACTRAAWGPSRMPSVQMCCGARSLCV